MNELNSKADFESAIATPDKFVFIFIYENEMPEEAKEKMAAKLPKHDNVASPYVLDISKVSPEGKAHYKLDKVPTVLIFKDGTEVKRVEEVVPEKMAEVEELFKGGA